MAHRQIPLVFAALTALFVLVCVGLVDYREAVIARDTRIESWLRSAGQQLEETLSNRLNLIWGLGAFVQMNPDFSEESFLEFAGALETRWGGIRSLQLAPGGVVTYMTQPQINEKARGHDLLADPERRSSVMRAIENREYIIAGPFELIQGGIAIVGRMPIYLPTPGGPGDRFWGFATIMLEVTPLLETARLLDDHLEFEVALRGTDGLGDNGAVFFGEETIFEEPAAKVKVALPAGSWTLAARPREVWPGQWPGRVRLWLTGAILSAASALIIFGLLCWPRQLNQAVRTATRALAESRQQYRKLARIAPSGIYHADADGNILYANDRFREIIGVREHEISGDCWDAMVHPDDLKVANDDWYEAVKSGFSRCEYRIRHEDGTVLWVLDQATKIDDDADGNAAAFIGTLTDITELKSTQAALEDARRGADAANAAKSEFLASISHEIRTPLNGILGMVRIMQRSAPDEETKSRLVIVEHSADTLLELLNEVLDFSQIEAGRLDITYAPFRVDVLMQELAELWRHEAREKGLSLETDLGWCPAEPCMGDAKRIRQVISNLLSNAIKFTDRGSVRLRATLDDMDSGGKHLVLSVEDTGIGIETRDREMIFDEFIQADGSASRRYDGTGLGLAICKQLTELMGGRISVSSVVGEGSTFTVTVPCPICLEPAGPEAPEAVSGSHGNSDVPEHPVHILVAEDNHINQQVIAAMLDQPNYVVDMVGNGEEAVERIRMRRYDLILMDIRMPELDGKAAARQIRALGGHAGKVPIVALTANAAESDRTGYLAAGMSDCVTKPIDLTELMETIRRHTRNATVRPRTATAAGG